MTGRGPRVRILDAFTTRPFEGNPAAVVLDGADLSDDRMQAIAREMNLSETAFLLPPVDDAADVRIRWFTPTMEVDLCGHATVAAFTAALAEGRMREGTYRMECRSGILPVTLERAPEGVSVILGLPVPTIVAAEAAGGPILEALGLDPSDRDPSLPVMAAGPPDRDPEWALVPVARRATLAALRPDHARLRRIAADRGIGNTIVLTRETVEPGSAVHLRMFAPAFGIDEDPVTGSAQGPVAVYLVAHRVVTAEADPGTVTYTAEQGDAIGRPGRITTHVGLRGGACVSVRIQGRAVTVLEGTILPE